MRKEASSRRFDSEVTVSEALSNLLHEERRFEPTPEFAAAANVKAEAYVAATIDWDSGKAGKPAAMGDAMVGRAWSGTLRSPAGSAEGTINASVNCVDRHVAEGRGDRIAFHFEGEPGDTRTITYAELLAEVCKAANALTALGIQKGDRVAIYLPMIPEAVISMLACARIGAPHSVIFGGFSAQAIYDRVVDADAKLVITADGGYRRGSASALKPAVDEALGKGQTNVSHVLVVRRTGGEVPWNDGRDIWWHEFVDAQPKRTRRRGIRRGASALHPLHIGDYREAEGHPAHDRRVPDAGRVHPLRSLRPQAGPTCSGARPTSDG